MLIHCPLEFGITTVSFHCSQRPLKCLKPSTMYRYNSAVVQSDQLFSRACNAATAFVLVSQLYVAIPLLDDHDNHNVGRSSTEETSIKILRQRVADGNHQWQP